MMEEVKKGWIANFWRRIGALVVDGLILGLVGFLLGLALESTFVKMGNWGRLIGFLIGLVYFGVMNSKLFNGQTIGKKLLNIIVVDSDNQPISVLKSILRYIVFAVPFSLNGVDFGSEAVSSFIIYPFALVVFGGLFSISYLYLFNRVTRQSLHDLAVGSFVVNASTENQDVGKIWTTHLVVVAIFFIAAAAVPAFTGKLTQNESFNDMLAVQSAISSEPEVTYVTIFSNTTTVTSSNTGTRSVTFVTARAFLSSDKLNDDEFARKLATIVVRYYPDSVSKESIRIILTYGYDIGIWSRWLNHVYEFNPGELIDVE
ncbi:RDD family protein [Oceanobacter mangrovi]|uniref:RDD family protein n=1 Tax=Oceanobacter mangrovi TaxID=2862510 RepID=UPI001C8D2A26|nr:RDD family protein [Oceanobacter mangrovi]